MDFMIAASKFMRSHQFLDFKLQTELEFAITTIELADIDNVGLHGRFGLWRLILRDRFKQSHEENCTTRAPDPIATSGVAIDFSPIKN
jgi:hypothetical protein